MMDFFTQDCYTLTDMVVFYIAFEILCYTLGKLFVISPIPGMMTKPFMKNYKNNSK